MTKIIKTSKIHTKESSEMRRFGEQKLNKQMALNKLSEVFDPELNISVVDLGFIYKVIIKKDTIKIVMTLTTIGCPMYSTIEQDIKTKLQELGFKKNKIQIDLTFDPAWNFDMISKKGKKLLGI